LSLASAQETIPAGLKIEVVEGEGAINNISEGRARDPVVRVTDDDNRPVAGAAVTFLLPELGAGGSFPTGSSVTLTTGDDGVAAARGLKPNNVAGEFQIRVTASYRGVTARALITQNNAAPSAPVAKKGSGKTIAILAILGGGAAGAAVALAGKGGSTAGATPAPPTPAPRPPTTITPGGGTFGPP
jgi:hypothetical protein